MAKANIAKKVVGSDAVTFAFTNGRTVEATLRGLPEDIIRRLALHGLSQKLGDSYASANDKGMTIDDCADGVLEIIANLEQGVWAASGGGTGSTILAEAVAKVAGKTIEEATAVLAKLSDDQRKAVGQRPDVKAALAEIKAERAAARAKATVGTSDVEDLIDLF